jgi:hypothetical protein
MDQGTNLSYVYHQLSMSLEETVRAKETIKRYAKSHGVRPSKKSNNNALTCSEKMARCNQHPPMAISTESCK